MTCILLCYGGYNVDFDIVCKYFSENHSFKIIKLSKLKKKDFLNGQVIPKKKKELIDQTIDLKYKQLANWKVKKIVYPIYFKEQAEIVKWRAYIDVIELKQPFSLGYKKYLKTLS